MIKPTVGRVVWFRPYGDREPKMQPLAAIITYVHSDTEVNLAVFGVDGTNFSATIITLKQEEDQKIVGMYCEWMPYQIGQAKKEA